jgi:DNA-binding response OmpR family regulator
MSPADAKANAKNKTVLLVEDDREISSTIQSVLQAAGYNVVAASNGVEGQRLNEKHLPDLVITDMMMPTMGGFPVLEYLKSLDKPPRVIMITANEGGRHKAYAEMLGVDDYLRKPFAMDALLDSVSRVLAEGKAGSGTKKSATTKRSTRRKAD